MRCVSSSAFRHAEVLMGLSLQLFLVPAPSDDVVLVGFNVA